ncbi:hypothetical protein Chor_009622 [Crotalus horridus]
MSPCNQDITTASLVSIGCLIKGYFPQPATVQWNSGAITSGIHNFPPVSLASDHYTYTSLLTIPVSQWQSQEFQCNVEHAATDTRINKRIERSVIRSPVGPEVKVFQSSCDSRDGEGPIQLWCLISDFYPKQVEIDWKVGSRSGLMHPYNYHPWQNSGTYTFSTASVVNITRADWLEGNNYYCEATHAASQTKVKGKARKCEASKDLYLLNFKAAPVQIRSRACWDGEEMRVEEGTDINFLTLDGSSCLSGDIKVDILPPRPKALYIDRNGKISCVVSNLQNEQGVKFTWSREKSGHLTPDLMETIEESGAYTVVSRLDVFSQDWDSGETFTCVVEHPAFVSPITKKISKTRGKHSAPKVYVFPPHQDELNPGRTVSLICMINGFSPAEADVQWLRNHNPLSEDNYVTTPPMKNKHDDSYFLFSKLAISRPEWETDLFTCMVIHEDLPMKFTQRNISKTQGVLVIVENDYSFEKEEELEHLWTILFIFFILFLLSVCYSATITLFKVKWLFSTITQLRKKPTCPNYRNIIQ